MLKLTATGHIGRDATAKEFDGQTVINFTFAHSEAFTDKAGNRRETTTWIDCHYWRPTGKIGILPYLTKGTKILLEGTPNVYTYTTRNNETRAVIELKVTTIELLGSTKAEPAKHTQSQKNNEMPIDDMPF